MNQATLKGTILPSLLAGTGRQPLKGEVFSSSDPNAVLKAMSLAGQALRFERPHVPTQFAVEVVVEDSRRIIPDTLRRPLLRLLAGKTATEHPAMAIARAFDTLRLRPHPFDLPRLDSFVGSYSEKLGTTAQHWVRSKSPTAEVAGYFDDEVLDDTTWTQAPAGRRAGYLEARRRENAAVARQLLEATWQQESADVRLRLLQGMYVGLSVADQAFLATLEKDRAPRVRALAQRLLSRLGIGAENIALNDVLKRITWTQTGLLRKRPSLKLELPATIKQEIAPWWIRENFSEISFEELAKGLSLAEIEVVEAASKDENLLLALALISTADRRLDLFAAIVAHLPNAWERIAESGLSNLALLSSVERLRWAEIVTSSYGHKPPWDYSAWKLLHRLMDGPAPSSLIETIVRSKWLDEVPPAERQGQYWMEVIAALCPSALRQPLRERLDAFDSSLTSTAVSLVDVLDAMEKVQPR